MIICSANNIDIIQGSLGYGDTTQGVNITDWRISNTQSGVFNIFNSSSITPNISILDNGTVGIGTVPSISSTSKLEILGNLNITGAYNINNRNVIFFDGVNDILSSTSTEGSFKYLHTSISLISKLSSSPIVNFLKKVFKNTISIFVCFFNSSIKVLFLLFIIY
jgi:hypothetical protein